ncbi:MAG TPA: hypothetical protein VK808_11610 [Bacteroidia bacterium]|jgi:hypothetical protein|nr:hypothetical protein [Bacteroidia bacterium]
MKTSIKDLFEFPEQWSAELAAILNRYDTDIQSYKECEKLLKELELLGYTFDYGLDGNPYDLRKITFKIRVAFGSDLTKAIEEFSVEHEGLSDAEVIDHEDFDCTEGEVIEREFITKEALDAYVQGLNDCFEWRDYSILTDKKA